VVAVAALLLLLRFKQRIARSVLRILFLVGIAAVVSSSTPLPLWIQAAWCVQAFVCMVIFQPAAARARIIPHVIFLAVFSAGLCVWDATYRIQPKINVAQDQAVYVIGDSISAGLGRKEKTWPTVLAGSTHLNVTNLAQPGETLTGALQQVRDIKAPHALVILEIGGNDLLGGAKAADFRAQLETLLAALRAQDQTVVMFELPLLPFHNGIGEAQRSLAEKYHVTLIPKRYLAAVIGGEGNTGDGLHLSPQGHSALAEAVKGMLVISPGKP
jgi:lysophospholipase L1-like esterase